ncbi:cysteine--tRNA ligase [Jiella marina]|uniref:cysteine--tRNA ligase n=1 Tax=Jiella sp. LLJ827 TaxID=2917712 RepID=UPI0021017EF3|nr:cysteine--tRNA ligase [Jiella sp. LLJ827]MCQ0988385.1 cysteine--tRNA ligase [Jiella sp. LLJ827]
MTKDDGFRGLTLFNTMTRQKEAFRPLDWRNDAIPEADRRVRMYVCGPTVYDYAHIGNARPVIVFDVLYRLLRHLYGDDRVVYTRNITDVDDKINARALRDYPDLPLNEAIRKVTETTAAQFEKDAAALGNLEPTHQPRATDFVSGHDDGHDMVSMIATLIEKGHAYQAGGEVLFDVTSMEDYGGLSRRKLEEMRAGARVAVDEHKKNPGDFVLWKLSSPEEPGWDSPWGRGRPGWHIECSVMSAATLGQTFDIHGGGLDLIFPHHENEIAQSRCAHGTEKMAEVWMHNGYLQVEGRKMSKSEGNFVTIQELLETEKFGGRKWPGEVLRLAMLMTHYREPIDFSVRRLEEAENLLRKFKRAADLAEHHGSEPYELVEVLKNDLDMATVLSQLSRLSNEAFGRHWDEWVSGSEQPFAEEDGDPIFDEDRLNAAGQVKETLILLGFDVTAPDVDASFINAAVDNRLALIRDKNWAEADRIRDELAAKGIQLKDGKDPKTGERVTTWEVKR